MTIDNKEVKGIENERRVEHLINLVEKKTRTERHLEEHADIANSKENIEHAKRVNEERENQIENLKNILAYGENYKNKQKENTEKRLLYAEGYLNHNADHMDKETFKNTKEKILLSDEIHWIQNYVHIMSARFEGKFTMQIDIPDELLIYKVPKFFLQPLVENSIIHGFAEITEGGIIRISSEKKDDNLSFIISDNGKGMTREDIENSVIRASQDKGIGISNVHRRLTLIYGEKYHVHVESAPGKGTSFYLTIPCEL